MIISVHPHVCGADVISVFVKLCLHGSPPRVWGRCYIVERKFAYYGSPPRVWGRFPNSVLHFARIRFTPTCVGQMTWKTKSVKRKAGSPPRVWGRCRPMWLLLPRSSVHPHVCGADVVSADCLGDDLGSPPRVWGRCIESITSIL